MQKTLWVSEFASFPTLLVFECFPFSKSASSIYLAYYSHHQPNKSTKSLYSVLGHLKVFIGYWALKFSKRNVLHGDQARYQCDNRLLRCLCSPHEPSMRPPSTSRSSPRETYKNGLYTQRTAWRPSKDDGSVGSLAKLVPRRACVQISVKHRPINCRNRVVHHSIRYRTDEAGCSS